MLCGQILTGNKRQMEGDYDKVSFIARKIFEEQKKGGV